MAMDLLSVLRSSMNPGVRPLTPREISPDLQAPKPIAPAEIEQLQPGATTLPSTSAAPQRSFDNLLGKMVDDVNRKLSESSQATNALLSGQEIPLHRVMIASEEASLSFQLMVEVRNKVLEAYQELMRMQV